MDNGDKCTSVALLTIFQYASAEMILVSELQFKQALKRRLKNQDFNGIRNAPLRY